MRPVLRGIDLVVERGERVALMGRNGAGKSTLLRAVAGLVEPASGTASAPGRCALLSQDPADFLLRERVGDELPGEAGRQALEAVGLAWAGDADPRDLSGGERQRLALAIVMAGRGAGGEPPGLVCLDEPTRGMDRGRKEALARWLGDLAGAGAGVVVATHEVEFAAAFAERTVLLGEGETIADGPSAQVLSGGWYFATEVARALGAEGAITPEAGAELLRTPAPAAGPRAPAGEPGPPAGARATAGGERT
jgi:energy-coupling factor transport system ATP-binding protein